MSMYSSKHEKDRIGSLDGKILSTDIADFPGKTILKHNDIVQWDIYKQTWVTGQLTSFPQIQANQQSIVDLSNNTGIAIQNAINNVVGDAPAALDTLKEIADIVGDTGNLSGSLVTKLGTHDVSFNALITLTNKHDISQNAFNTRITNNTNAINNNISTIASNNTTLSNSVSGLSSQQSTNNTNITTHTTQISNITTDVSANTVQRNLNTNDISSNLVKINKNILDISSNDADIARIDASLNKITVDIS